MSRNLDAAIAEALGYHIYHYDKDVVENCYYMLVDPDGEYTMMERKTEAGAWNDVARYSRDGNAMLWLISEMHRRGWEVSIIFSYGKYHVRFTETEKDIQINSYRINILPEAVAQAVYKTFTGEDWQE